MYRSNLQPGFSAFSVAFNIRNGEAAGYESRFTSHKQSNEVGMHRLFQPISSLEVPVSGCLHSLSVCQK